MGKTTSPPGLQIRVITAGGDWLGPGKADLLAALHDTGSIPAAAARMGMDAARAAGLVEVMNAMFAAPLVADADGAGIGAGARLTPTGERVLALYRRLEARGKAALAGDLAEILALCGTQGGAGTEPDDAGRDADGAERR